MCNSMPDTVVKFLSFLYYHRHFSSHMVAEIHAGSKLNFFFPLMFVIFRSEHDKKTIKRSLGF